MFKTEGLLGRQFSWGTTDCFGLGCDFYDLNFGLRFPNVARPEGFYEKGLDLFMGGFRDLGFELFHGHPRARRPGDVALMAIRAPVASHCGVLFPDNKLLHHLPGQVSCVESYQRPLYRDTTVAVLRHPAVQEQIDALMTTQTVDAWTLIPERVRRRLEAAQINQPADGKGQEVV